MRDEACRWVEVLYGASYVCVRLGHGYLGSGGIMKVVISAIESGGAANANLLPSDGMGNGLSMRMVRLPVH